MPILIDHDGKECYRSEAQIERMSGLPVCIPMPKMTPEEKKQFNKKTREIYIQMGWKIPDEYKD